MRKLSIVQLSNRQISRKTRQELVLSWIIKASFSFTNTHDQILDGLTTTHTHTQTEKKKSAISVSATSSRSRNRMKSFPVIFAHHLDTSNMFCVSRASNYTLRRLKTQMRIKSRHISRFTPIWNRAEAKVKRHFFFGLSFSLVRFSILSPARALFLSPSYLSCSFHSISAQLSQRCRSTEHQTSLALTLTLALPRITNTRANVMGYTK